MKTIILETLKKLPKVDDPEVRLTSKINNTSTSIMHCVAGCVRSSSDH